MLSVTVAQLVPNSYDVFITVITVMKHDHPVGPR